MAQNVTKIILAGVFFLAAFAVEAAAEETLTNQVFFRGAYSSLVDGRGGEVFTDTGAANGTNGEKGGFSIATGVNLGLTESEALNGFTLIGEVFMEYSRFSAERVRQTTSALLGGTANSDVHVSVMNVAVSPKARFDGFGPVRPFIIPVGVAFLVNSPPSNDSTYLDLGLLFAGGIDLLVIDQLSLGVDFRYTMAFDETNTENSYFSVGSYAGINF